MIASGAQLEAYDVHFGPPLHIASAKGHVDCVKELLIAGQNLCNEVLLFFAGEDRESGDCKLFTHEILEQVSPTW